jgi:linoleoyl-CoA desaturase
MHNRANSNMVVKTVVMLLVYTAPYVLLCLGVISSPLIAVLLYLVSGLGMGGIGMGVMHDANHGAYTKQSKMNTFLSHTLDYLGCSSALWKIQHNVLHHSYTNIHGHDEDINAPLFLFRFSPHSKRYKIQKFQHIYIWFFYGLLTLYWITAKDFIKVVDYYQKGLIRTKKEFIMGLLKLIPFKLFYFLYALVIPMYMAPFSSVYILIGFLSMHVFAGILLSVVFQLAHVVPDMKFPQANENNEVNANWFSHQLHTTSNFSPKSKFLFWYLGGLTNQIEHHLFPNICHVHYRNLSKIVARTASDFQLPYNVNKTMFSAVSGHLRTLRLLGNKN